LSSIPHTTPSSVKSGFSSKISPCLVPSIILRRLGGTPPASIKRKLFDTPDKSN